MRVLVTGSHFTPAQATIEQFQKSNKEIKIFYIGRNYTREGDKTPSLESLVLPKLGVKFLPLITGRLQRSFTVYTIPSLLKIPIGFLQSLYYLIKYKPDVVLSFGGYVAVPVVISAWFLSIPIIIHEQTLVTGIASKITSWFADKIAVSFNKEFGFDEKKVILTGNPIRGKLINTKLKKNHLNPLIKTKKLPVILITGGNQGSHIINQVVMQILERLVKDYFIIIQTGDSKFKDFEALEQLKQKQDKSDRLIIKKWLSDSQMAEVLQKADLVVSRAGINILLELVYYRVPAIVIPIPYIYRDEQTINGKYFEKLGVVKILPQTELSGDNLHRYIKNVLKNSHGYKSRAEAAERLVIPDAAKRLAIETVTLSKTA